MILVLKPWKVVAGIAVVLVGSFLTISYQSYNETELGEKALLSLYDYSTLEEFDINIEEFRSYVTEDVFARMTANNSDRVLFVYLKFRAEPVKVNIVESKPGFIVYSLITSHIDRERLFMFSYTVENGKITSINEGEVIQFTTNGGWYIDPNIAGYEPLSKELLL